MLIAEDAVAKAFEMLSDDMFHREQNRRVFRAMQKLFNRGEVIDPIPYVSRCRKRTTSN